MCLFSVCVVIGLKLVFCGVSIASFKWNKRARSAHLFLLSFSINYIGVIILGLEETLPKRSAESTDFSSTAGSD